ncbi:MAG: hypothetical protein ACU837_07450 [Gammaproteobacteria bacterium]
MNAVSLQNVFLTAAALAAATYTASTNAHDLNFKSLGKNAKATDTYEVTCSTDGGGASYKLQVRVRDDAPLAGPLVSAQIIKDSKATNTTDLKDGDANFSAAATLVPNPSNPNGGNGVYTVVVDKTKAGAENYSMQYHCLSKTGEHTGTSLIARQNQ